MSVAEYERLNTAEKVRNKMIEQAKRASGTVDSCRSDMIMIGSQNTFSQIEEAAVVVRIYEYAAH